MMRVKRSAADVRSTLKQRGSVHGDFTYQARSAQATKTLWRMHPGYQQLDDIKREALEMIALKVARILCGDPEHKDHWRDIAGYAVLVEDRCK